MNRCAALIPAAGVGARFGANLPKQYMPILDKPVLRHTADKLLACERLDTVLIIVSANDAYIDTVYPPNRLPEKLHILRCGGETRAHTVYQGICAAKQQGLLNDDDWLLVHDAARCCLPNAALTRLLDTAVNHSVGGLLAIPVSDTLKRDNGADCVADTVSRARLWQAQTPQMFRTAMLHQALAAANLETITDESSAIEALGLSPLLVLGDVRNIKLTQAQDAVLAELFLRLPF
ncbi:2-C-methyl-D-erythritol 4-phosphate cytidylyltransferase [Stenoxybacter acetivorans]|uniref:2-C-methyl-D-erythritol 4-phosphate cytidylyltransferase n=1 Tax=Stenoxybacter acetivorans TaxID=422441 RepID=UPI000560408D|nr:2-C-methyl-D-erythritol 4-phosphate cytidylyltransferase [Stenoxybacter acetivorans]